MEQYLIDTNSVIDYLGNKMSIESMAFMNLIIDETPKVSVITQIEVLGFNAPEEHYQLLEDFINDSIVFQLTDEVIQCCIQLRKAHKIKLPDALIAATAIVYDLILITRNVSDFKKIAKLKTLNPHNLPN